MSPSRRRSRFRASSNSPAATRSATSFLLRSHLVCGVSAMVTLWLFSSTGTSSNTLKSSPPKSMSMSSPQAPPAPDTPGFRSSSKPKVPPSSVSSGASSMASWNGSSSGAGKFSMEPRSKIDLTDCSKGQFPASPAEGRIRAAGGSRRRALAGMWDETSLPCICSSSFGMNSVMLCAFAVRSASGTCPISAMIFTRSSTFPSIRALLKRDMTSWRCWAIHNILPSLSWFPVIKYRNDNASKLEVF
mmetsp:Transcript_5230/g.13006  ORF Transcript_5230/g.13006 Transcript_5230/m.13006 type:complete len:245 (+) Transcript_5230:888-1622(+)